jgi:hypothetical protein
MGTFLLYAFRRSFGRPELVFCGVGALLIVVPIASRVAIKHGGTEITIEGLQEQVEAIQTDVKQVAEVQGELVDVQQQALQAVVRHDTPAPAELNQVIDKLGGLDRKAAAIHAQIQRRPLRARPQEFQPTPRP